MYKRLFVTAAAFAAIAATLSAQTYQRRASLIGGGGADWGKCTVAVVVDGAAEVEVRGDTAIMRNLSGQAPEWRRFDCTAALPATPASFRFTGEGRGRQELVRDPTNGGVAVVRIEDQQGGAGEYTFELTWRGGVPDRGVPDRNRWDDPNNRRRDQGDDRWRETNRRMTPDDAIRVCQDSIRQQAADRFRSSNIVFRRTSFDESPGRQEWIAGTFEARRGFGGAETHRFACSVDFDRGRMLSAQIDPVEGGRPGGYGGGNVNSSSAVQACEQAAEQRIRREGYGRVDFESVRVDDRPGGDDRVFGTARAEGRYGWDSFSFSCGVRLESGAVRSVDVSRR